MIRALAKRPVLPRRRVSPASVPLKSLVKRNGMRVFASSFEVAVRFNKRHDNVLRAIRNLDCSGGFSLLNFEARDCVIRGKSEPCFDMTKDRVHDARHGLHGQGSG